MYPIIVLIGLMATLFSCLRVISYNQQVYASSQRVEAAQPSVESHSSTFATTHISRRW